MHAHTHTHTHIYIYMHAHAHAHAHARTHLLDSKIFETKTNKPKAQTPLAFISGRIKLDQHPVHAYAPRVSRSLSLSFVYHMHVGCHVDHVVHACWVTHRCQGLYIARNKVIVAQHMWGQTMVAIQAMSKSKSKTVGYARTSSHCAKDPRLFRVLAQDRIQCFARSLQSACMGMNSACTHEAPFYGEYSSYAGLPASIWGVFHIYWGYSPYIGVWGVWRVLVGSTRHIVGYPGLWGVM